MHFVSGSGRPPEEYVLRKLRKRNPELWGLAGELIQKAKRTPQSILDARKAAREKIAVGATAYMALDEDKPL